MVGCLPERWFKISGPGLERSFGVISQVFERILSVAAVMIEHAGRLFFWLTQAESAQPLDRSFHLRSSMDALQTFLAAAVLFAGAILRGKRSFAPEWRNGRGFTID